MRKLFLLLLLVALSVNAFSDVSLTVDIFLDEKAHAHVIEQTYISLENEQEVYTYTTGMGAIKTTLSDWKKLTKSNFLTYHTAASPVNQRILPQKPTYNSATGKYYATISLEYDTEEPFATISQLGPRRIGYQLITSRLSFKLSPTGDIVLPKRNALRITIPKRAKIISANPKPDKVVENTLIWEGPYTLAKFDLRYEIEQTLSEEVQSFISSTADFISHNLIFFVIFSAIFLFFIIKVR